jgi:hypothetical protein
MAISLMKKDVTKPKGALSLPEMMTGLATTPQQIQSNLQGMPLPTRLTATPPKEEAGTFKTEMRGGKEVYIVGNKEVSAEEYRNLKKAYMGGGLTSSGQQMMGEYGIDPYSTQMAEEQRRAEMIKGAQAGTGMEGVQGFTGEPSPIDQAQVWAQLRDPANIRNIVVAGGIGAFAGVKAGTAVAPLLGPFAPAGPVGGGIIGGIIGVSLETWRVLDKNIKSQRTDKIGAQLTINRDSQRYKNDLVSMANIDPQNADVYWNAWLEIDTKQRQAWAQLQIDSRTNLNLRLGEDATRELQRFYNYYEGGGYMAQRAKMEKAIAAPDFTEGVYGLMMSQSIMGD